MDHLDKYSTLTAKFFAGQSDPSEERDLFAWIDANAANQKIFEEWATIWTVSKDLPAANGFKPDLKAAWQKIDAATPAQVEQVAPLRTAKVVRLSKMALRWSVAAAVLLAVGISTWWANQTKPSTELVHIQTFENEKKAFVLPDSSKVWLNENSSLTYDPAFEQRHVTLEGEAFFEVEKLKERPFEIISGDATTTVLGTSFNVRAYAKEDKIEVTVKTGKVALARTKNKSTPIYLSPGETGVLEKKALKLEIAPLEQENADAWKTSKLSFDDEKLSQVIAALERYFNVKIEASNPALLACPYTSSFEQPDLDTILTVIGSTIGFEFTKSEGRYVLTGKGCQ